MIRHITIFLIQDEQSKLWYHLPTRSWVHWEHASIWHTRESMCVPLGRIASWNLWCDKDEQKRKPKVRSFDSRLNLSIP